MTTPVALSERLARAVNIQPEAARHYLRRLYHLGQLRRRGHVKGHRLEDEPDAGRAMATSRRRARRRP